MSRLAQFTAALLAGLAAAALGIHQARQQHQPPLLAVAATPPGAAVFVDDVFHGYAPEGGDLVVPGLAPGRHTLRVAAAGHQTDRRALQLAAGPETTARQRIVAHLEPIPRARLRIESTPRGALVLADGAPLGRTPLTLANLEPGRHSFTLALDNYLPKLVGAELVAGDSNPPLAVELADRQVEMYRARLAANPDDIQAYNDFGEYLYTQGNRPYAAQIYAEGFHRLGDGRNNRLNEAFNKAGRGQDKEFMEAFDQAVVKLVADGKHSPQLWTLFNRASDRHPNDPQYVDAFASLARRTDSPTVIDDYLTRALKTQKTAGLLPAIDHWLELPDDRIASRAKLLAQLGDLHQFAVARKLPDLAAACLERADTLQRKVGAARPFGADAIWPRALAGFARKLGKTDDQLRHLEAAAVGETDRIIANRERLELARAWAERAKDLKGDAADAARRRAAEMAAYIVRKKLPVDPAREPAGRLLDALAKNGLEPERDWPAKQPLEDWLVVGPFPTDAAADAVARLVREGPPETVPYADGQRFPTAAGEVAWRRVRGSSITVPAEVPAGKGAGTWFALGWIKSEIPITRELTLSASSDRPARLVAGDSSWTTTRPDKDCDVTVRVKYGWTPVLFKWEAAADAPGRWSVTAADPREKQPLEDFFWTAARE